MSTATKVQNELRKIANPKKAEHSVKYLKAGKGEYGQGDKFIGLTVPQEHKVAKMFRDLPFSEVEKLLLSPIHEYRQVGFMILGYRFEKANEEEKRDTYDLYLKHKSRANNWDLIDGSAPKIVGGYLSDKKDKSILYELASSQSIWDNRIAIMATFTFIKNLKFDDTLKISEILLNHPHDLIHKAVGWMLREVGNRDLEVEEQFLKKHYKTMPRTMLRYAIEKFEETKRQKYLKGLI